MIFFQSKRNMISFEDDRFKENIRQIKHTHILILLKVSTKCRFIVGDGNATK